MPTVASWASPRRDRPDPPALRRLDSRLQVHDPGPHAGNRLPGQQHSRSKDVSNRLDLENHDGVRGDREMSTCEMMDVVWEADYEIRLSDQRRVMALTRDLRTLSGVTPPRAVRRSAGPRLRGYCLVAPEGRGMAQSQRRLAAIQPHKTGRFATRISQWQTRPGPKSGRRPASGHPAPGCGSTTSVGDGRYARLP